MKFVEWFFDPLVKILLGEEVEELPRVELPKAEEKVPLFRPKTFSEYIGQDRVKSKLQSYIKGTKERKRIFPHTLIHGFAGCGKTTLARIIANEIGVKFIETITSEMKDFLDIEMKIEEADGGILFLDEIHSIERDTAESIYTVMEDFTYEGEAIKPFTIIGATTELGEILKNRRPFYDRFKLPIELEDYTTDNIATIVSQYKDNTFPLDRLEESIYTIIGKNSRATPRTGIRLLEATIYLNGDIKKALEYSYIIKDGYTEKDLKVLKYICKNEKGVGLQGLCSYLGTSTQNYVFDIEPYLLKNELIIRTSRGRKITEDGIKMIKELSK